MKNSQISEIKNALFPSDTKLKIRFKYKNMFRETLVHKWDIVTIYSRLLYTIPRTLITRYHFYRTSSDHKQHTSFVVPMSVKGLLVYRLLEKFYTTISSVIDLSNKFMD